MFCRELVTRSLAQSLFFVILVMFIVADDFTEFFDPFKKEIMSIHIAVTIRTIGNSLVYSALISVSFAFLYLAAPLCFGFVTFVSLFFSKS